MLCLVRLIILKCREFNMDKIKSDIEKSDHALPLSSIITSYNDNVNAKYREINLDYMESDIENYSDHELPLSSIINALQPINFHKIVNTDIRNSTYDGQSILNNNYDNKFETNPPKNKDQSVIVRIKKYECDICEKIFPRRNLIIEHFKTSLCFPENVYYFENNYNYNQYINVENSASYINYISNLKINDIKKAYKCCICQTIIQNHKLIKNCHILDTKKNNFKCGTCLNIKGSITNENTKCVKEKCKWKFETCKEIFNHSENKLFDYDKTCINVGAVIKLKNSYGTNKKMFNFKSSNQNNYYISENSRIHNSSQKYECSTCSKVFHKRFKIITHIFTNHQEDYSKYSCDPCSNLYDSSRKFILHVKKKCFKCDVCPQSFITSYRLHQHYKWHLGINHFKCQFCPKTFSKCSIYLLHERTHTREKPFRCHYCNKWFPISSNLNIHLGFNDPFICNICEKSFYQISSLVSHKKMHVLEKQSRNKRINNSFYQSLTSETHSRQHTSKKMFICKVCNKLFIQSSSLNAHSKTHSKSCLNKFDICSMVGTRKHTEDKCFKCNLCQKTFSDQNIFTAHQCNSRECKLCKKILCNSFSLKRHYMYIHKNKKPLETNKNKHNDRLIQTRNVSLKLNIKNSKNELEENNVNKEYKCDLCTNIFYKQSQIYEHILKTHY